MMQLCVQCAILTMAAKQALAVACAYETLSRTCLLPTEPSARAVVGRRQAPLHAICARSVPVDSALTVQRWASSIGVWRDGTDSRSLPSTSKGSAHRSGFAARLGWHCSLRIKGRRRQARLSWCSKGLTEVGVVEHALAHLQDDVTSS